jgi:deoxyhypusine monooxygenase
VEGDYTHIIVHEAVEALGNINDKNTLNLLEKYRGSGKVIAEIVEETCEVSQALLKWNAETQNGKTEGLDLLKPKFHTNDPAPGFNYVADKKFADITFLTKMMLDDKVSMFDRYRALFTLRNIYTKESCEAIC